MVLTFTTDKIHRTGQSCTTVVHNVQLVFQTGPSRKYLQYNNFNNRPLVPS